MTQLNFGARIYNPAIGRFTSIDPDAVRNPHYSPYSFAANNPIMLIDYDGRWPVEKYLKLIETVFKTAPKREAARRVAALINDMHGGKVFVGQYFEAIGGIEYDYNKTGDTRISGQISFSAYGKEYKANIYGHEKKNSKEKTAVRQVIFNDGAHGKGVSGGAISADSGFEIRFANSQTNTTLALILDEKEFRILEKEYENLVTTEINKAISKNPQLKDFVHRDKVYNEARSAYNDWAKTKFKDVSLEEKYNAKNQELQKIRKEYAKKYKKK